MKRIIGVITSAFLIAACAGSTLAEQPMPDLTEIYRILEDVAPGAAAAAETEEVGPSPTNTAMETSMPEDRMAGAHEVPDEAASVLNPLSGEQASVSAGAELYATNCAVCHGETGEGDGPAAAGLAALPADLHEDHVQALSDGALFYIISHGKPDTSMPAWENVLTEEQRWHVVNFMRTFGEG